MNKPCIILGGGGHASVLLESLRALNHNVIGVISLQSISSRKIFQGLTWYKSDEDLDQSVDPDSIQIVNGIGPLPYNDLRARLQLNYETKGFEFVGVTSPAANISKYVESHYTAQVMRAATIQAGVIIGKASVVNTSAVIDHDCYLADFTHVAPAATLCGGVVLEENVYIGANATVLPGIRVGAGAVVGAGAIVKKDVAAGCVVLPAKSIVREIE